jgi:outer membrane immunogenic protein
MNKVFFLFFAFFGIASFASDTEVDLIQMKNGDVFRGKIIEQEFGKYIQIKFKDGNEKRVIWNQVKTVKKDASESPVKAPVEESPNPDLRPSEQAEENRFKGFVEPDSNKVTEPSGLSPRTRVFGGFILTTLTTESPITDWSMGSGFHAGVAIESPLGSQFSFLSGIEYTSRVAKASIDLGTVSVSGDITLGYILVPVLSRINFESFSIGLGPYVGFTVSANGEFEGTSSDIMDGVSGIDLGARAYATLDFGQPGNAFIGAGYDFGFTNINDSGSIDEQIRSLFFDLGFRF